MHAWKAWHARRPGFFVWQRKVHDDDDEEDADLTTAGMDMGRATAAVLYCTEKVRLASMSMYAGMQANRSTVLAKMLDAWTTAN
jgi:hypothetical protein